MMLLHSFLPLAFAALSVSYILQKWGKFLRHKLKDGILSRARKSGVPRFNHFGVRIPLLDGLYTLYCLRKYGVSAVDEWNEKTKSVDTVEFTIGPYPVIFSRDAAVIQKILSSSDPGHLSRPKSIYGHMFTDFMDNGLFTLPYEVWTHQRKIIARAFTFRSFNSYVEIMNKHSKNLARELSILSMENGGEISGQKLVDYVNLNTVKISLEFIMGSEISDCKEAIQFSHDFWEFKEIVVYRFLHPELYIPFLWWFHPKRKRFQAVTKNVHVYLKKIVEHYQRKAESDEENNKFKKETNPSRCLIEEMLKQNASPEEIYSEIATFIVASHETISVAMKFLLHHLACHPEYEARCRGEVDNVMDQCNNDLTIEDLSKLEYLERFIMESLRINPTVPFTLRELNTPLEIEEGFVLEKGKILAVPAWTLHRNPKYYPNPDVFDPDRFLPEEVKRRGPGTFVPFSGGVRNCIGKRFAMLEMKTLLAWILRNFEVYTEDALHEVKLFFEVTLRPERNFRTTLRKRTKIHSP